MILVDVNLLVSAAVEEAQDHEAANTWLGEQLSAPSRVGLPWLSLSGFVRVAVASYWPRPLGIDTALDAAAAWLARPNAWVPEPGAEHLRIVSRLLQQQPYPRLLTDAHLAAIAIEHGLELCSRDRDFARWASDGLRSRDPLDT